MLAISATLAFVNALLICFVPLSWEIRLIASMLLISIGFLTMAVVKDRTP